MNKSKYQPLTHPVVFSAFFTKPYFAAEFLNATEKFNVKEEDIIVESTKQFESVDLKVADLDVLLRVVSEKTTFINLEMQNRKPKYDILDRIEFYLARLTSKSEPRGYGYQNNKSVALIILNFTLFDDQRYLRTFKFKDEEGNERNTNTYMVLELTKANLCNKIELKDWLDVFNNQTPEIPVKETELMKKVSEELRKLSDDPMFQLKLDLYEAKQAFEEYDKKLIIQEAIEEGKAQGIAQGVIEGEKQKAINIAKAMKSKGFEISTILEVTGLTKEEVENI